MAYIECTAQNRKTIERPYERLDPTNAIFCTDRSVAEPYVTKLNQEGSCERYARALPRNGPDETTDWLKLKPPSEVNQIPTTGHTAKKK